MKVFILSASAAFWHKIGKGCNVDIIMIEVEKGGGKVDCTFKACIKIYRVSVKLKSK